jgi:hypothetical protein
MVHVERALPQISSTISQLMLLLLQRVGIIGQFVILSWPAAAAASAASAASAAAVRDKQPDRYSHSTDHQDDDEILSYLVHARAAPSTM